MADALACMLLGQGQLAGQAVVQNTSQFCITICNMGHVSIQEANGQGIGLVLITAATAGTGCCCNSCSLNRLTVVTLLVANAPLVVQCLCSGISSISIISIAGSISRQHQQQRQRQLT